MGAETTVRVKVLTAHEEWIEVQAVTLTEAMTLAEREPGVIRALSAEYERERGGD